ncbi:probable DNA replication complex GINS protein PSF2 [Toxorhynchites rutilus septentrionalis]|uniref:probable DNA replication complex GINS protein PSF2 n=1 Tax=Toxorhynchites rutilus septentrionalis TaxID=329112 RepID=UPI00247AF3DF|nr:probable DNA replication complex GINS protein PSF2 [Toxorhynchites rutilus septentrionalis]
MEPDELEFIGENSTIGVIPNFNHNPIYLISGVIGPFRGGYPLHIPLWLAIHLRQQQKCRIVPPEWMDVTLLEEKKEKEKKEKETFTKMPSDHYMVEAKLVLNTAPEDVPQSDEIKTLIKDIWDTRCAKLRKTMDLFLKGDGESVNMDNVTIVELHTIRPFLPHAMDLLTRIQKTKKGPRANITLSSDITLKTGLSASHSKPTK